ncbi:MAG: hypothetical protein F6K31_05615 [Symploca sp. SIO2G7]|nr:hypothetical protein [Symploca sp. SIO2G7]
MSFVKKLPWTSLLLLLCTYVVFGWLVSVETHSVWQRTVKNHNPVGAHKNILTSLWLEGVNPTLWDVPWWYLLKGIVCIVLITLALTDPFQLIKTCYSSWLQSDFRAFISVVVGSLLAVIIIVSLDVFVRILLLIAASTLARLDLQIASYSEWQAFWLLSTVSLIGYSLGITTQQFLVGSI